jgi:hypothetical protein
MAERWARNEGATLEQVREAAADSAFFLFSDASRVTSSVANAAHAAASAAFAVDPGEIVSAAAYCSAQALSYRSQTAWRILTALLAMGGGLAVSVLAGRNSIAVFVVTTGVLLYCGERMPVRARYGLVYRQALCRCAGIVLRYFPEQAPKVEGKRGGAVEVA